MERKEIRRIPTASLYVLTLFTTPPGLAGGAGSPDGMGKTPRFAESSSVAVESDGISDTTTYWSSIGPAKYLP